MGTSNPASLAGTHPAPPPMCEIEKGRLHDPPAWVGAASHPAYSSRSEPVVPPRRVGVRPSGIDGVLNFAFEFCGERAAAVFAHGHER